MRNLINDLKIYFIVQPNTDPLIRPWSILGIKFTIPPSPFFPMNSIFKIGRYVRRCIIIYEKMSFEKIVILSKQTTSFLKQIKIRKSQMFNENSSLMEINFNESNFSFHKPIDDNNMCEVDLDGSVISIIGEPDTCSSTVKLKQQYSIFSTKQLSIDDPTKQSASTAKSTYFQFLKSQTTEANLKKAEINKRKNSSLNALNGCALSRKTAEYFISQQAYLIENNEHESLLPTDLHKKIDELFSCDSSFPDVFFLKYLNSLRIKDYSLSSKYLHDYFDRFIIHGSIPLAALNLVSLEYRFSNKYVSFLLSSLVIIVSGRGNRPLFRRL